MMTKFSKNSIVIIFLILASFAVANFVFAQADLGIEYGEQIGLSSTDPRIIIARVIQVALGFLGIIAVVLIMYAGWLWMTSEGNEEKIEKAKNILKNAIIGLVIILSSFGIASFILNKLMGATGGGPGAGGGGGGGSGGGIGVLGSCTVESVYPEPDKKEVPRNTSIIVTFREEIATPTICADTNGNGLFCDTAGDGDNIITDGSVMIYKSVDGEARADKFIGEVKVSTKDNKTFVFTPRTYLGSPSESIWYTVYLSNAIKKVDGDKIFDTCSRDYLEWQFQVSNKIDLEPPRIKEVEKGGVFPLPSNDPAVKNYTNSVIQINFNEAINPITVSGSADEVKDYIKVVNVTDSGNYLQGKFVVSNQYQTVEFLSDNQCGVNGCGEKIYCLPSDSQLKVELKAAALAICSVDDDCATHSPYNKCIGGFCQDIATVKNYPAAPSLNGIVDIASNSLDGDRDGGAEGPGDHAPATYYNENSPVSNTGDNYQWSFSTSNEPDLTSPFISSILPDRGASGANLASPVTITFSKPMMSSSLRTGFIKINNGQDDIEHKLINLKNSDSSDPNDQPSYWTKSPSADTAEIWHSIFKDSTRYRAQVGSGVKDTYQNCFKPSSGPDCSATPNFPSCCADGTDPRAGCPEL